MAIKILKALKNKKRWAVIIVVIMAALAGGAIYATKLNKNDAPQNEPAPSSVAENSEETEPVEEDVAVDNETEYANLQKQISEIEGKDPHEQQQIYVRAAFLADAINKPSEAVDYAKKALVLIRQDPELVSSRQEVVNALDAIVQSAENG